MPGRVAPDLASAAGRPAAGMARKAAGKGRGVDKAGRKIPDHEITYKQLRDMILFGRLAPGQPVTIQGLAADLGAGITPVREAIRRLAAEGALQPQGNRRVTVPPMTAGMLEQVAFARLAVEPELARRAAPHLTPEAIAGLAAIDERVNDSLERQDIPGYLEANHAFHFALYDLARAPVLCDLARSLWLRAGPSLRVVIGHFVRNSQPDLHHAALAAMRAGDAQALGEAMARDISQGLAEIRNALGDRDDSAAGNAGDTREALRPARMRAG